MKSMLIALLLSPLLGIAQLRPARIFSHNMVLQRDQPIEIWGKCFPKTNVQVSFMGLKKIAAVATDSSWSVSFPKQRANAKPQSIVITSGNEKIQFDNILIGDIWVCSGQSNMEWPMQREMHWKEESVNTNQPLIRFINPPPVGRSVYGMRYTDSLNRRLTQDSFYLWNGWQNCDSNSIKSMSAVAYYFAKQIVGSEKIPVGLINLSIGGAPIETFISRDALQHSNRFAAKLNGDWLTNESIPVWARERGNQNVGGNTNGFKDDLGLNHAYKPGFAYAAGIAPILKMPVKGVIWYQGESNAQEMERVNEYKDLFRLLVNDYRTKWRQPIMPFYWVQLSSIDTTNYKSQYWPQFRNEQRLALIEIEHGGMAVCSDIGDRNDVHPTNKKAVGERLARWALNKTYHKNIVPSGPLPLSARYLDGKLIITFQYMAKGLKTSDGKALTGFSTDGQHNANAQIGDSGILILVDTKPDYVYYGWKPFSDGNLVNSEDLPASTFKIEVR